MREDAKVNTRMLVRVQVTVVAEADCESTKMTWLLSAQVVQTATPAFLYLTEPLLTRQAR